MTPILLFALELLLALPMAIALHELGHYVPAKLFRWNPHVYFRKHGHFCGVAWSVPFLPKNYRWKEFLTSFLSIIGIAPYLMLLLYAPTVWCYAMTLIIIAILSLNTILESVPSQK